MSCRSKREKSFKFNGNLNYNLVLNFIKYFRDNPLSINIFFAKMSLDAREYNNTFAGAILLSKLFAENVGQRPNNSESTPSVVFCAICHSSDLSKQYIRMDGCLHTFHKQVSNT